MKSNELQTIENLKEQLNREIYQTTKQYLWFDAYDDNDNIYEFKYRHTDYNNFIIEFRKWSMNYMFAHINDKKFLYVVEAGNHTYIFDINELGKKKHNYNWGWRSLKAQTEFSNNKQIDKYVGYIPKSLAVMKYKTRKIKYEY